MADRRHTHRQYRRRESGHTPVEHQRAESEVTMLRNSSTEAGADRVARRKARQQSRLRLRKITYALAAVLLLGIVGVSLALNTTEQILVRTVLTPTASQPNPAPSKPAPSEAASSEPEDTSTNSSPTNSGLAGNPDALKERIEEIAIYYGGVYRVEISDPASGENVSFDADETFFAASIGKLPTLLSLYKSAARGEVNLDEKITMQASDVQGYGTGVLHTYPVGYTLTLRETAFHLINDSDNTAWTMLTRYLGEQKIQADLMDIGAYDTGYWIPNTTTANDVLLILEKIADPSYTSPELTEEMLSTMTDTFSEDRIPGGLPPDVRVAHKIGTYGTNFSDAGIVFHGDGGPKERYSIVVFAEGMGEASARSAVQEISAAAHQTFGPDAPGS